MNINLIRDFVLKPKSLEEALEISKTPSFSKLLHRCDDFSEFIEIQKKFPQFTYHILTASEAAYLLSQNIQDDPFYYSYKGTFSNAFFDSDGEISPIRTSTMFRTDFQQEKESLLIIPSLTYDLGTISSTPISSPGEFIDKDDYLKTKIGKNLFHEMDLENIDTIIENFGNRNDDDRLNPNLLHHIYLVYDAELKNLGLNQMNSFDRQIYLSFIPKDIIFYISLPKFTAGEYPLASLTKI